MRLPPPNPLPNSAPTTDAGSLYLTNDEAAAQLRLSPRTLEKMRVIGGGPPFRKHGRRVLYARKDLEAWSNTKVFDMTSDPGFQPDKRHRP